MRWAECLPSVHCTAALAQSTGIGAGVLLGPRGASGKEGAKECTNSALSDAHRPRGPEHKPASLSVNAIATNNRLRKEIIWSHLN